MRIAFFDAHAYERPFFNDANSNFGFEIVYFETRLTKDTVNLAKGFTTVCCFVNDHLDRETLKGLAQFDVRLIALRCAGFNNVDLKAAQEFKIQIVRVPEYSPYAVAEHALGLILSLNRKIHKAYHRVREMNFTLDGLVGFDLNGKTVGLIGTGKIGRVVARAMHGLGCQILAFDINENAEIISKYGVKYCNLKELYQQSDIISLHVPLTPGTHHILNAAAFDEMKNGVMIINTGRGALIDTKSLLEHLKSGKVGSAGLDVYEEEENYFFKDLSEKIIQDDVLARLLTLPNVLITAHQGFLTREALANIAQTTLQNIEDYSLHRELCNQVKFQEM